MIILTQRIIKSSCLIVPTSKWLTFFLNVVCFSSVSRQLCDPHMQLSQDNVGTSSGGPMQFYGRRLQPTAFNGQLILLKRPLKKYDQIYFLY